MTDIEMTERPLVLIVDDQTEMRQFARMSLAFEAFQIVDAANGHDALALVHRLKPQAVLLDILMPGGVDGIEVCRRIKSDPQFKDTVVIMMSSFDDGENRASAFACGANAYIGKPFSFLQLLEVFDAHLRTPPAAALEDSPCKIQ